MAKLYTTGLLATNTHFANNGPGQAENQIGELPSITLRPLVKDTNSVEDQRVVHLFVLLARVKEDELRCRS